MEPVDIVVASLRKPLRYDDGTFVMLDKLVESIQRTCPPASYRLHVADDPDEPYTAAIDRLLRQTEGDVVHLDDDHLCLVPGWIEAYAWRRAWLVAQGRNPAIMVGRTFMPSPQSLYVPGALEQAGNDLSPRCVPENPHFNEPDPGLYEWPRPIPAACFGGAWISRRYIQEAGGLDQGLRAGCYQEDIEYSLRAWALGYEVWYVPDVAFIHLNAGTKNFERLRHRCNRNISYNAAKYGPLVQELRTKYNTVL